MKRALSFLLLLTCILSLFTGSALAEKRSSADAESMIYQLFESNFGYTRDQLKTNQIGYNKDTGVWTMSAILIDCPQDEDGIFIVEMDNDGNIVGEFKASEKISLQEQLDATLRASVNSDNCYLQLAKWTQNWTPMLNTLIADDPYVADGRFNFPLEVLKLGITEPAEGSISYDDALVLAKGYIQSQPNWPEGAVEMYTLNQACYYTPQDIGRPVYFFYFSTPRFSDSDAEKVEQLFDNNPPMTISLLLDAVDGSLVETPIQDFPPVRFFSFMLMIRTEEVIAAGQGNEQ